LSERSGDPVYGGAAGMNGEMNRAEARQSEGGLASAKFRLIPHRLRWGASLSVTLFGLAGADEFLLFNF